MDGRPPSWAAGSHTQLNLVTHLLKSKISKSKTNIKNRSKQTWSVEISFNYLQYIRQGYFITTNSKYGFKARTSFIHSLVDATVYISSNLDNIGVCMGTLVDLPRAFDSMDHAIYYVENKPKYYGVRSVSNDFLKQWLR